MTEGLGGGWQWVLCGNLGRGVEALVGLVAEEYFHVQVPLLFMYWQLLLSIIGCIIFIFFLMWVLIEEITKNSFFTLFKYLLLLLVQFFKFYWIFYFLIIRRLNIFLWNLTREHCRCFRK
jgi:hypothetical protein